MRALALFAILGLAGPAAAQPYLGQIIARDAQAQTDAQAARSRDIAITNELSALQARAQSDQALSALQAARSLPAVPSVVLGPHARAPVADAARFVSIPDAALAQSNARIRAAAENRR